MAVSATSSERNYIDLLNGTTSVSKKYNAEFTSKSNEDLSVQDFFNMMVTQLTNQDFMNPIDDTQYLAQMAQFATMQEMMDLCQFSKQNYVMDMLGKEVTLTSNELGGNTKDITGKIEKIGIENGEYKVYVNGSPYDYSKVKLINGNNDSTGAAAAPAAEDESAQAVQLAEELKSSLISELTDVMGKSELSEA